MVFINEKNAQVFELGKASDLTLGKGWLSFETFGKQHSLMPDGGEEMGFDRD